MTREEAVVKARTELGDDAIVGHNHQKSNGYYVGRRIQGDWVSYGAGASWEEALLNHRVGKKA